MKNFNAGRWVKQSGYLSFQPSLINRAWQLDDMEVILLNDQAKQELGKLEMYSQYVPNLNLFISMHVLKEANQSSAIEGTQTNVEEILMDPLDVPKEKRDDWDEVQNYIKAMNHAIVAMRDLPFSSRLIRDSHAVLMQGVRGDHKAPGHFRVSQNWIGGASLSDATFIPPHHSSITELMSDLELFLHNEAEPYPDLLKIAIAHYQFETIHPFLDGNGRIGRLLITLFLVSRKILSEPVLYLSDFFEQHRSLYYSNLQEVRTENQLRKWLKFFLVGIIETAQSGVKTFDAILKLQRQTDDKLNAMGRKAANGKLLIQHLYQRPLTSADAVSKVLGISPPTAYSLLTELEHQGILREITGFQRGKLYVFDGYVKLFK